LDGATRIGDSTGVTATQFITTTVTTRAAIHFTIAAITIAAVAAAGAPVLTLAAAGSTPVVTDLLPATAPETGLPTRAPAAAVSTIGPAQPPGLSAETTRRLAVTRNPADKPASARARSAAMTMVDRQDPTLRAEGPAPHPQHRGAAEPRAVAAVLVAAQRLAAAAGILNRKS
jgi:hypothetical protein